MERNFERRRRNQVSNKKDLVELVYSAQKGRETYIRKYMLEDILDILIQSISDAIVEGKRVEIRGFGRFYPLKSCFKERDLQSILCKSGPRIIFSNEESFKASKFLLRRMNGGDEDVFGKYFGLDSDTIRDEIG